MMMMMILFKLHSLIVYIPAIKVAVMHHHLFNIPAIKVAVISSTKNVYNFNEACLICSKR